MVRIISQDGHKQPGCHFKPLFNIPPDIVLIDELHLILIFGSVILYKLFARWRKTIIQPAKVCGSPYHVSVNSVVTKGQVQCLQRGRHVGMDISTRGDKRLPLGKLPELFEKFLLSFKVEKTKSLYIVSITLEKIQR